MIERATTINADAGPSNGPGVAPGSPAGAGAEPSAPTPGLRLVPVDPFGEHNLARPGWATRKRVLALDIGTAMGWALLTPHYVASGAKKWQERRGETRGGRLYRFYRWLTAMRGGGLDLIAYELVRGHGPGQILAAHCYGQFEGVLLAWAARHEVAVETVHTGTLKKAVTGRGNAKKPEIGAAVRALGFAPSTHDEADALAVLRWAHVKGLAG